MVESTKDIFISLTPAEQDAAASLDASPDEQQDNLDLVSGEIESLEALLTP